MDELKKKARELNIRGMSQMRKKELIFKVELYYKARELNIKRSLTDEELAEAIKEEETYGSIKCRKCLEEQHKQRLIDKKTYNQLLYKQLLRNLARICCKNQKLVFDDGVTVCGNCGTVLGVEVDYSGNYFRRSGLY